MDRKGPVRDSQTGHGIRDPVAPEHGDLAFAQPGKALHVQPDHALRGIESAAGCAASHVAAGRDHQDVAGSDRDVLASGGLLELGERDGFVAVDVLDAPGRGERFAAEAEGLYLD